MLKKLAVSVTRKAAKPTRRTRTVPGKEGRWPGTRMTESQTLSIERVPPEEPTDLVGISVETYSARRAYRIADAYRARGVRVVLGGYQPTVLPDEAAAHADAVVIGEAEGLWPGLLEDARRGRLQPRYRSAGRVDMSGVLPRREIFRGRSYLPIALVHFGRGCTYGCSFCALSAFYAPRYNRRPVADALADA